MVWYGMVWYGMVQYSIVLYIILQYSLRRPASQPSPSSTPSGREHIPYGLVQSITSYHISYFIPYPIILYHTIPHVMTPARRTTPRRRTRAWRRAWAPPRLMISLILMLILILTNQNTDAATNHDLQIMVILVLLIRAPPRAAGPPGPAAATLRSTEELLSVVVQFSFRTLGPGYSRYYQQQLISLHTIVYFSFRTLGPGWYFLSQQSLTDQRGASFEMASTRRSHISLSLLPFIVFFIHCHYCYCYCYCYCYLRSMLI